jgi:hypothetical protein
LYGNEVVYDVCYMCPDNCPALVAYNEVCPFRCRVNTNFLYAELRTRTVWAFWFNHIHSIGGYYMKLYWLEGEKEW